MEIPVEKLPKHHRWIKALLALLVSAAVLLMLSRCVAFWAAPASGRIIDGDTGSAIEGAYVLAYWGGRHPMHWMADGPQGLRCYRIRVTVTNGEGKYRFSPEYRPQGAYADRLVAVRAYVRGMRHHFEKQALGVESPDKPWRAAVSTTLLGSTRYQMEHETNYSEYKHTRPAYLAGLARNTECSRIGNNVEEKYYLDMPNQRLPFLRALYEEGRAIAITDKDWEYVAMICDVATYRSSAFLEVSKETRFNRDVDPMCPVDHPSWTGADPRYRKVFEQIEKDFGIQLEEMPR